jgi:hypothetical protein
MEISSKSSRKLSKIYRKVTEKAKADEEKRGHASASIGIVKKMEELFFLLLSLNEVSSLWARFN